MEKTQNTQKHPRCVNVSFSFSLQTLLQPRRKAQTNMLQTQTLIKEGNTGIVGRSNQKLLLSAPLSVPPEKSGKPPAPPAPAAAEPMATPRPSEPPAPARNGRPGLL